MASEMDRASGPKPTDSTVPTPPGGPTGKV